MWNTPQMRTFADLTRPRMAPPGYRYPGPRHPWLEDEEPQGPPGAPGQMPPPPPSSPVETPASTSPLEPPPNSVIDRPSPTFGGLMRGQGAPTGAVITEPPPPPGAATTQDERSTRPPEDPPAPPSTPPAPPPSADSSERDRAINEFWRTIQPGESPLDALRRAYRHFLGREIDPDTLAGAQANPQSLLMQVQEMYDSEEARAYRARGASPPASTGEANEPLDYGEAPSGFDGRKWSDPNYKTLKYLAGRILHAFFRQYGYTEDAVRRAMASPQWQAEARLRGATYNGRDRINFNGAHADSDSEGLPVYSVDVISNFGADNAGTAWQDEYNTTPSGPGSGRPPGGPGGPNPGRPPAVPPSTPIPRPGPGVPRPQAVSSEPYRLLAGERVPMSALMTGRRRI